MSIFNQVNVEGLNKFIALMQSHGAIAMQPIFTDDVKAIFNSNDSVSKAEMCARRLIDWQNNLNRTKNNPNCAILFDKNIFNEFINSQKILNKLKRKFSKLLIADMTLPHREMLTEEASQSLGTQFKDVMLISHLFEHYGDDAICLKLIAVHAKHRLDAEFPKRGESVILGDGSSRYRVNARLILPVLSAAEHFDLASNAWGYQGQQISPLTAYATNKDDAVRSRLSEVRKLGWLKFPQSPWDLVLGRSEFTRAIQFAKFFDGCPIGNCAERSDYKFRKIVKQRQFDLVLEAEFQPSRPADHVFVIFVSLSNQWSYVLDAWNGARVYANKDKDKYLEGYAGTKARDGTANVVKFDPNLQHIHIKTFSIFPVETFKKMSRTQHIALIELLKEFHQTPKEHYQEKMLKAMEIVLFIENRMPLYEYTDPAVHELYDQMVYLTKKERKKGLALPPLNDKVRCLVNEALQNLDLPSLEKHLRDNQPMDSVTLFHAIKASLRANNIQFLQAVVNANVPIKPSFLTNVYDSNPREAIIQLANLFYKRTQSLDLRPLCMEAVQNSTTA